MSAIVLIGLFPFFFRFLKNRSDEELSSLRRHDCFSECLQIIIDPSSTLRQHGLIDSETARVPGYLENVRLKMVQVVKQMMTERHRIIEEEHRRALDQLHALQTKCDYQCNTLLKIIEYQETAEERKFSSATTKSCSSVHRSESTESKASLHSGSKEPALDDDVFEMQFNDEAIYEDDSRAEQAEEARGQFEFFLFSFFLGVSLTVQAVRSSDADSAKCCTACSLNDYHSFG